MAELFFLVLPLYLLIGTGFTAVRTGLLPASSISSLGTFVLNLALPALIVNALMGQSLQETFNAGYLAAYAIGSLAVFLIILCLFMVVLRRSWSEAAIAAYGSSSSNSGFVGLPVVSLVLGATALTAVPLAMLVENLLILPLSLTLAEMGQHTGKSLPMIMRDTLRNLVRSPLLIAIVLGATLSAFGIQFPPPIAKTISLLATASVPCALLIIGGMLANMKVRAMNTDALWIAIGKLALHPIALTIAFMFVTGVPEELRAAGIILASAPMVTIFPIIGARFGQETMSATALLLATTMSFITITIVLALVRL